MKFDNLAQQVSLTIQAVEDVRWNDGVVVLARTDSSQLLLKLRWYQPNLKLSVGDQVVANISTKPPHELANLGGFSYRRYLLSNNIAATGVIRNIEHRKQNEQKLIQWLNTTKSTFLTRLHGYQQTGLIAALTLGHRDLIEKPTRNVFAATGTAHLMAISGLHVGMVYFSVLGVLNFLLSWLRQWSKSQLNGANGLMLIIGLAVAFAYAAISGFALPTIRAWLFLLALVITQLLRWQISPWRILFICAATFITIDPATAYDASFWLSFTAVAAVLIGLALSRALLMSGWRQLMVIQFAIVIILAPLQAALFGFQSAISPFINLLVIPWLGIGILPIALIGICLLAVSDKLGALLITLADFQLDWMVQLLKLIDSSSTQQLFVDTSSVALLLISLLLLAICKFGLNFHLRYCGCLSIPIIISVCWRQYVPVLTIDVLDVGQGLSVVARSQLRTILYDTGAAYPSGFNMADAVINPYLQHQGIHELHRLILSHDDNDHSGSASFIHPKVEIQQVISSFELNHSLQKRAKQITYCHNDNNFSELPEFFTPKVLPFELVNSMPALDASDNDKSCVVQVGWPEAKVLLPGDISKAMEHKLLQQLGTDQLQSSLLLAPHHGSNTSSSDAFIKAVAPEFVVFSSGFRNRWRFPAQKVHQRYQNHGVNMLNTATSGMLRFQYIEGQWVVKNICDLQWPVWYQCD